MIWLRHPEGAPFVLRLQGLGRLEDTAVSAAARGRDGRLWACPVRVLDDEVGTVEIDGAAAGRAWPAGLYAMDVRLTRGAQTALSRTFGIAVLDPEGAAEDARRRAALPLRPGLRRVWSAGGEVLDAICRRELGTEAATTAVYDLNPGLALLGPLLPPGVGILVPEAPPPAAPRRTVRLWGAA